MNRRGFLGAVAGMAAAGLAAGDARAARFASAPATGGGRIDPLGLQLYTVRDRMAADVEGTLAAIAGIGYREVEFAGTFGRPAADLRRTLDSLGLAAPSAHVPLTALVPDAGAAIDDAAALGNRWLVVAWIPPDRRTLDDYRRFADEFNRIGASLRAAGLRFAYHNHDFELARVDDVVPYDMLLERTDPALVDFEMDLYWVTKGGGDPLDCIARFPGRFPLVHAKDMGPRGEMVDAGKGRIPFDRVLAAAPTAGIRHWYVEHDDPADPLATARASFDYLSSLAAG